MNEYYNILTLLVDLIVRHSWYLGRPEHFEQFILTTDYSLMHCPNVWLIEFLGKNYLSEEQTK